MPKIFAALAISLFATGCATDLEVGDWPLQNQDLSASLTLADDLPPLPGSGTYLAIPGYVFVAGEMIMHPGKRRISYACPGDWPWRQVTHFIPTVEHDFEAGHRYELYCENGYPMIKPLP